MLAQVELRPVCRARERSRVSHVTSVPARRSRPTLPHEGARAPHRGCMNGRRSNMQICRRSELLAPFYRSITGERILYVTARSRAVAPMRLTRGSKVLDVRAGRA